jgi:hypothetical protein
VPIAVLALAMPRTGSLARITATGAPAALARGAAGSVR